MFSFFTQNHIFSKPCGKSDKLVTALPALFELHTAYTTELILKTFYAALCELGDFIFGLRISLGIIRVCKAESHYRACYRAADFSAAYAAAKAACCHDFIMALPNGYDTVIGEGGSTLSGGEKQRISIARALLKDAPVVLLDEATASLDVENESAVQTALSRLLQGKTVLVIAHRMRTVAGADHIVVLEDGHVVQQGTPAELMEQGGLYRRMVELQSENAQWRLG